MTIVKNGYLLILGHFLCPLRYPGLLVGEQLFNSSHLWILWYVQKLHALSFLQWFPQSSQEVIVLILRMVFLEFKLLHVVCASVQDKATLWQFLSPLKCLGVAPIKSEHLRNNRHTYGAPVVVSGGRKSQWSQNSVR